MSKAIADFIRDFTRHDLSATGVIFIRSREPNRVEEALSRFAQENGKGFRVWDMSRAWRVLDPATGNFKREAAPLLQALKAVLDIGAMANPNPFPPQTLSLFSDFQAFLGKDVNPEIVSILRHYAWQLPTEQGRSVVLSVPETFTIPEDLAHDCPVIDFGLPDTAELEEVIRATLTADGENRTGTPQNYTDAELAQLANSAAGLTILETEAATCAALIDYKDEIPRIPFLQFDRRIMSVKADTIKSSGFLEVMPPVDPDTVGGLDLLKVWGQERKADWTPEAKANGVKRPRGATLIGPPGTGKSLAASTLGALFGVPSMKLHIGALFGGIVGQTEGNVRRVLKDIAALGRCIIFADEVDRTMGMNTTGGDGGITKRMIGTLLDFMQSNETGAFFVFAANRAEGIDSALVRKGRIDEVFGVLPPNRRERLEIIKIHLRKAKRDPDAVAGLNTAVDGSEGYVGAELESAVQRAVSESFRTNTKVTGAMILAHIATIKPLSVSFAEDFAAMEEWASKNAVPASSPDRQSGYSLTATNAGPARRRRATGNN